MKVVLEAQHTLAPEPRGIGYYSLMLLRQLLRRARYDYELTFFDYGRERGNRQRAEALYAPYGVPLHECNDLDYRTASRDESVYRHKSYNAYTRTWGDVYHFTDIVALPTNITGRMVVTVHDLNWLTRPECFSPRVLELYPMGFDRLKRMRPKIIADSHATRLELLEASNIPEEDINVIHLSCDEENLYPEKDTAGRLRQLAIGDDYLLFVGTLEQKKNVVRIVKAFDRVAGSFPGLQLVLAGKPTWDDPKPIYDSVESSPYRNRIVMPGYVDTATKRLLYSGALCFLFPSLCEGFGLPVLEAMACGAPVVTSNTTSLPEVAGDAALLIDPTDVDALADAIERVLSSAPLREAMVQRGLLNCKRFSWGKTAVQVEKVYKLSL